MYSEDPRLAELLANCRKIIESYFTPCGLADQATQRIRELFNEWIRRYEISAREGRTIGSFMVIFYDLLRLVRLAQANSERYNRPYCEYLRRALERSYHERGGFGYYSIRMWQ